MCPRAGWQGQGDLAGLQEDWFGGAVRGEVAIWGWGSQGTSNSPVRVGRLKEHIPGAEATS